MENVTNKLSIYTMLKDVIIYMNFINYCHCKTLGKKVKVLVTQSCLTLCDPLDCLQGSSVRGILQARILD